MSGLIFDQNQRGQVSFSAVCLGQGKILALWFMGKMRPFPLVLKPNDVAKWRNFRYIIGESDWALVPMASLRILSTYP